MKRQMEKSTSIDKNKETASHESEIQVYDYIKSKSQLEQRSQKLNQELKKSEQYLEYLTKEQKEIKEKIKHHFSANKDLKILFDRAQELKEAKNRIDSSGQLKEEEIKKLIKDQENLENRQSKLEQDKKELKQSMDSLQLLERELNDAKVIGGFSLSQSGDSRYRRSESTISDLIQVLKQANAAVGDSQEENHKLESIESWSKYIKSVDKSLERWKQELSKIPYVIDLQASSDREIRHNQSVAGPSGSSEESHPYQLITRDGLKYADSSSKIYEEGYLFTKSDLNEKMGELKRLAKADREKVKKIKNIHEEISILYRDDVLQNFANQLITIGKVLVYEKQNNSSKEQEVIDEYGKNFLLFTNFYNKLLNYSQYHIKSEIERQEWKASIDKLADSVKEMSQIITFKTDKNKLYSNDEECEKSFDHAKVELDKIEEKLTFFSRYELEREELYKNRKNISKTQHTCNEMLQKIEEYRSEEYNNFSKHISETLPTIYQHELQSIHHKIQKDTKELQHIHKELEEKNHNMERTKTNIDEHREDIKRLDKESREIKKEIRIADKKFKDLNLSKEEIYDLRQEKYLENKIKVAEEEKTKIEEQLKRLKQF